MYKEAKQSNGSKTWFQIMYGERPILTDAAAIAYSCLFQPSFSYRDFLSNYQKTKMNILHKFNMIRYLILYQMPP